MPTWDELQDHARKTYTLNRDEESFFALLWRYEDQRTQQITVRRFAFQDQDWIEFRTFVAHEADLNPRVALRKNIDFVFGALALDEDGDYCVTYSARLATLDPEEFSHPLAALAQTADTLEKDHTAKDEF